jgi:hypothetical protein
MRIRDGVLALCLLCVGSAAGQSQAPKLEAIDDPPRLPRMTPRDAVQTPKAPEAPRVGSDLVKIDEIIEKDSRTGLRVTARNGLSYTLTDAKTDRATQRTEGTPMSSGKTALPTWQVLRW